MLGPFSLFEKCKDHQPSEFWLRQKADLLYYTPQPSWHQVKEFFNSKKAPESLRELFVLAGLQEGINRSEEICRRIKSGEIRFPKGVFRFKTMQEADEWKNRILEETMPRKS